MAKKQLRKKRVARVRKPRFKRLVKAGTMAREFAELFRPSDQEPNLSVAPNFIRYALMIARTRGKHLEMG